MRNPKLLTFLSINCRHVRFLCNVRRNDHSFSVQRQRIRHQNHPSSKPTSKNILYSRRASKAKYFHSHYRYHCHISVFPPDINGTYKADTWCLTNLSSKASGKYARIELLPKNRHFSAAHSSQRATNFIQKWPPNIWGN